MTVGVALRLVVVMGLWAACFPLITLGLGLARHLLFAALRAALAGLLLLATSLGFLGMFHAAEFVSPGLATVIVKSRTSPSRWWAWPSGTSP